MLTEKLQPQTRSKKHLQKTEQNLSTKWFQSHDAHRLTSTVKKQQPPKHTIISPNLFVTDFLQFKFPFITSFSLSARQIIPWSERDSSLSFILTQTHTKKEEAKNTNRKSCKHGQKGSRLAETRSFSHSKPCNPQPQQERINAASAPSDNHTFTSLSWLLIWDFSLLTWN